MAKANKRFYWIQLAEDFFKSKEMKLLRKIAGGDTYTIIYLKMMLMSLEDGGHIYYENIANTIAEEISLVIDESVDDIQLVLSFLESKGLLTRPSEDEYFLEQVPELTGSETASARRVRRHRQQKALHCNNDETKCIGDIEIDKELKKETDINIELEVEEEKKTPSAPAEEKSDFNIFDYYQNRIGLIDGYQVQKLEEYLEIDKLEVELVKIAIDRAANNSKRSFGYINAILKDWAQNGITTVVKQQEEQRNFEERKAKQQGRVTKGKSLKDEVGF